MKYIVIYILLFIKSFCLKAQHLSQQLQKAAIDSSVYKNWLSLGWGVAISNDGKYVSYTIENEPLHSQTLVLKTIKSKWTVEIPKSTVYTAEMTQDSKIAVFTKMTDTLGIYTLGTSSVKYIPHVSSFKLPKKGMGAWMAYMLNTPQRELVIRNIKTGSQVNYSSVNDYFFSDDGRLLIIQSELKNDGVTTESLKCINLDSGKMITIWHGTKASNIVFDVSNSQIAFIEEKKINNKIERSFWYYKVGSPNPILIADNLFALSEKGTRLENIEGFSKDGSKIFFTIQMIEQLRELSTNAVQVNVWSYKDLKLQPQQIKEVNSSRSYLAFIDIQNRKNITRLENENEYCIKRSDDFVYIRYREKEVDAGGIDWTNGDGRSYIYVTSLKDGKREQIKDLGDLSPSGKYEIYYDPKQKDYFSYEIASNLTHNISKGKASSWLGRYINDLPNSLFYAGRGVAGWLENDAAVLIYDQYDIWQLDPSGVKPPINLTNGYGRQNSIIFYLPETLYSNKNILQNESIILTAFNLMNKDNGFYRKAIGKNGDPEMLTMGPYIYDITNNPYLPDGSNFSPIKAQDSETYIVRRMSARESPNYFSTTNFKTFKRLSNLHPEKSYNWYTTELHTWKSFDGKTLQGILYKPDNFDPQKKYPILLNYYERRSDGLNAYIKPDALNNGCQINIPSFVSNGYIVFSPDIYYTIGDPMQGAYNSIVSAANYLSNLPFVESKKMGIQGCSFGGWETNYLITRTDIFSAACVASGSSEIISKYGSIRDGQSTQSYYELGQGRIGASLWENPDLYIRNSPIFMANNVTTPLLMFHTTFDGAVPFYQAIELFTALRRLGKKVWLLEYSDGDHGVWGKSGEDFSIRMAQFFDHYLKNKPAPKWMTNGVRASMKGIETGLELDTSGRVP